MRPQQVVPVHLQHGVDALSVRVVHALLVDDSAVRSALRGDDGAVCWKAARSPVAEPENALRPVPDMAGEGQKTLNLNGSRCAHARDV